jgi:isoquinoline 1-oxidoreductase subunit alpha
MADGLTIEVNGVTHVVQASPDTPLLYVLQDELQLHGPVFGCGLDQCGSCAVLIDGRKVSSCVTAVGEAGGKKVTTVEGLPALWARQRGSAAPDPELHPLQQAWIDEQVPQCGYCQAGMLIGAAELLSMTQQPSEDEIRTAMDGPVPVRDVSAHRNRSRQGRGGDGRRSRVTGRLRAAAPALGEGVWRRRHAHRRVQPRQCGGGASGGRRGGPVRGERAAGRGADRLLGGDPRGQHRLDPDRSPGTRHGDGDGAADDRR